MGKHPLGPEEGFMQCSEAFLGSTLRMDGGEVKSV
jgi:hypothetical protein